MSSNQHIRLSGGQVLRGETLITQDLKIAADRISEVDGSDRGMPIDLKGYLVLPGIIDLHGDAFERHLAPRPSAPFPSEMGLQSVDRDAAANGVTTAWMAQSWSWEGGSRGPEFAETFMQALSDYRCHALTDLRIQLRCETHTVDTEERLLAAVAAHGIDYVVFNDHLGEALDMMSRNPEELAMWAKRAGRNLASHVQLVRDTKAKAPEVSRYLCKLAAAFDKLGVIYGSHDDPDAETREYYNMIGARICEFPTAAAPARMARAHGNPILMGAPNVVRGGSQSGNIAALDLIRQGLCDVLVSDYHYPALARAAHMIADAGILPFGQAWQMISAAPARIMGLSDRGEIAAGKRADLVICNVETRHIEGTMVAGGWSHLCGALAHRIGGFSQPIAHAAE